MKKASVTGRREDNVSGVKVRLGTTAVPRSIVSNGDKVGTPCRTRRDTLNESPTGTPTRVKQLPTAAAEAHAVCKPWLEPRSRSPRCQMRGVRRLQRSVSLKTTTVMPCSPEVPKKSGDAQLQKHMREKLHEQRASQLLGFSDSRLAFADKCCSL